MQAIYSHETPSLPSGKVLLYTYPRRTEYCVAGVGGMPVCEALDLSAFLRGDANYRRLGLAPIIVSTVLGVLGVALVMVWSIFFLLHQRRRHYSP